MKEFQFKKPEKDKDPEIISEDPRITNNPEIKKLSLKIGLAQLAYGLFAIAACASILNGIASLFELEMVTHFKYKCVEGVKLRNLICTRSLMGSLYEAGTWCIVGVAIGSSATQEDNNARRMGWKKKSLIKKLTKNISN